MTSLSSDTVLSILAGVPHSHRPTVFQALGNDPSKCPMPCEAPDCTEIVALEDTYSPATGLMRHTGRGDVPHFVCPETVFGQHYYCSLECLARGVVHCLTNHLIPETKRLHAEQDARLAADHQIVPHAG